MRDGFKVIDADAHFYEPADIWDKYVGPQYPIAAAWKGVEMSAVTTQHLARRVL